MIIVTRSRPGAALAQTGGGIIRATVPRAQHVRALLSSKPPVLNQAQAQRLAAAEAATHRHGARTPTGPSSAQPRLTTSLAQTVPQPLPGTHNPNDFTLFGNTDLSSAVAGNTSVIDEPSVGNRGQYVLETGNWYAAFSSNGGSSFQFIDPSTTFPDYPNTTNPPDPSTYGSFCCDQSALYTPNGDLLLWSMLYINRRTDNSMYNNIIRLVIARYPDSFADPSNPVFYYYDFSPQVLHFPDGDWYDYPYLAVSTQYAFISTNVFDPYGEFVQTVVLRLPISDLRSENAFSYPAYQLGQDAGDHLYFNATLVQGATDTMYWATQASTSVTRVYSWQDAGAPQWHDVPHTPYPDLPANYLCPGPDGNDWCQNRLDDRVISGWVSNGLIGFMWTAPQGTVGLQTYPFPYVQIILVNPSDLSLAGESLMYNSSYAFAYPAVGLNAWGHLAGPVFYGGGTLNPTLGIFIWDDLSPSAYPTLPSSWEVYTVQASTQGPNPQTDGQWGDYLAARQDYASIFSRFIWVGTGYTLSGGGGNNNVVPRFLSFGRVRDDPATVQANSKQIYLPLMFKAW